MIEKEGENKMIEGFDKNTVSEDEREQTGIGAKEPETESGFEADMIEEACRRRRVVFGFWAGLIIVCAIVGLIVSKIQSAVLACSLLAVIVAAAIGFELFSKYPRCPYCNRHIYEDGVMGINNCPYCGGRIR